MPRWTVRDVEPDAIRLVQDMAITTGVSLGEALSAAVRHGAATAMEKLRNQTAESDVVEALERIQRLQAYATRALRMLYEVYTAQVESTCQN